MAGDTGADWLNEHCNAGRSRAAAIILVAALIAVGGAQTAAAVQYGMVANSGNASVTVFDMETHTVLGNVGVGGFGEVLDCSIGANNIGYVSNFDGHQIWAIDVAAVPPTLASGINPIAATPNTEDTAITPDQRFLLTCDGGFADPVAVIDLATRTEVSTLPIEDGCQGVEVCGTDSVLVVQFGQRIRRLTIDANGILSDTGEALALPGAFNVACEAGGQIGVALSNRGAMASFTIQGMAPVDSRSLPNTNGISAVVNLAGDRVYLRTINNIHAFTLDSTTGTLGATPFFSTPVSQASSFFGVDQLAINRAGTKLYATEANAIRIYSATSGAFVDAITDASIVAPAGLCATSTLCGDGTAEGAEACDDGNLVDGDGCDSNCTVTACGNGILTAGEQCDDGNAVDGDCCSNACAPATDGHPCSDNRFCNGADSCAAGSCVVHAGDPCVGGAECNDACQENTDTCFSPINTGCTDDGNGCSRDVCNGAGSCSHPDLDFVPCDDGTFCNGEDRCLGGECFIHSGSPCDFNECAPTCDENLDICIAASSGTTCFSDFNPCTEDACDGAGSCAHPPSPTGTACPADSNVCTADQCNGGGFCVHPPLPSGTSCTADSNVCTADQCNGAGSCTHPPLPDGSTCSDTNACTQTDACQSGQCVGTNPVVCPGQPCRFPETCDQDTGTCSACPTGFTLGGGGCQKTYAIDVNQLDNLMSSCDGTGVNRYNGCSGAFGFHWTDIADQTVGAVMRVELEFRAGVDCGLSSHTVSLNGIGVGSYAAATECTCSPVVRPQTLANVPTANYAKGSVNAVSISSVDCSGLSRDAQQRFATVTVTYEGTDRVAIRNDCRPADKSKLSYEDRPVDSSDSLSWKWTHGTATTLDELSDPTVDADYQFCVFGVGTSEPTVLMEAEVPAGSAWRRAGRGGYRYKDRSASQSGIGRLVVKSGVDGKARIILKGKGAQLSDPTLPLSPGTSDIRVQLTNPATGVCWESDFPFWTALVDDRGIKGRAP